MQYAYLDISGDISDPKQGVSVIGLVTCPDPRLPQLLLKVPRPAHEQVASYFREFGEYKFSGMLKAKPRVVELLENTLKSIRAEPTISGQLAVIKAQASLPFGCCISLASGLPPSGGLTVFADKGSVEQFDYFVQIAGQSGDPRVKSIIGLVPKDADIEQKIGSLAARAKINAPTCQKIKINHVNSCDFKGIQLADLVAGAAFQKEARSDARWIELLAGKFRITHI